MANFVLKLITDRIFNESADSDSTVNHYTFLKDNQLVKSIQTRPVLTEDISTHLSTNDQKLVKRFKRRSYQLDNLFEVFGFQIGLNSLIALIPIVGLVWNLVNSLLIYTLCFKLDKSLPIFIHLRLLLNIFIEFITNFIPVLGQLFNASYKANTRNTNILVGYLNDISNSNYESLLRYVNRDNRNNVNNVQFTSELADGSETEVENGFTDGEGGDESESEVILEPVHNLTESDPYFDTSSTDIESKIIKHKRSLSNSTSISTSTPRFFK